MYVKKLSLFNKFFLGLVDGKLGFFSVFFLFLRVEFIIEFLRGIFKLFFVKQVVRELQFDSGLRRRSLGIFDLSFENFYDSFLIGEGSLRDVEGEKSQVDFMELYFRDVIIKIQIVEEGKKF